MAIIEYAFLDKENIVQTVALFNDEINTDESVDDFAKATGYAKAINCATYGKPYILDTWDSKNKSWIETAPRISPDPITPEIDG